MSSALCDIQAQTETVLLPGTPPLAVNAGVNIPSPITTVKKGMAFVISCLAVATVSLPTSNGVYVVNVKIGITRLACPYDVNGTPLITSVLASTVWVEDLQ